MVPIQLNMNNLNAIYAEAQRDFKSNSNEKPEKRKDPGASLRRERGGELAGRSRSEMMLMMRRRLREFGIGKV